MKVDARVAETFKRQISGKSVEHWKTQDQTNRMIPPLDVSHDYTNFSLEYKMYLGLMADEVILRSGKWLDVQPYDIKRYIANECNKDSWMNYGSGYLD